MIVIKIKAKSELNFPHNKSSGTNINSIVFIVAMMSICAIVLIRTLIPLTIHIAMSISETPMSFAGPLPFTFTYNKEKKEVLIIEGVRENWTPNPVHIIEQSVSFIKELNLKGVVLANAFIIKNIPYYWKKGKIEQWK